MEKGGLTLNNVLKSCLEVCFICLLYLVLDLARFLSLLLLSGSVTTKWKTIYEATGKPQDKRWLDCFRVW